MSVMDGAIAANRFGLGARPGEIETAASDPRGWLLAQLEPSVSSQIARTDLLTSAEASLVARDSLGAILRLQQRATGGELEGEQRAYLEALPDAPEMNGTAETIMRDQAMARQGLRDVLVTEIAARTNHAVATEHGFRERLVKFWSNHFTVAAVKQPVIAVAGAFEREAIRPHVTGRFVDMLLAVEQHPAMLQYLDNAQSVGPRSLAGRLRDVGLNENLAREILELHTLGVDGGYTQDDVEELARAISGWTMVGPRRRRGEPGTFLFDSRMHEPGARTVLGQRYGRDGVEQGEAILRDLARHPSTARHVSTKLARHFVADTPPQSAVEALTQTFLDADGDLGALAATLVSLNAAWDPEPVKFKSHDEFIVSALRAVGAEDLETRAIAAAYRSIGQRPFSAPSPAGWPDEAADWADPDGLMKRLEWAEQLSRQAPSGRPLALIESALGPTVSARTREAVGRAESPAQGLTLALMSPEFQRR
ncbi:MAG: DUF1800 family protein [Maricaulaceae bacterium]|jgi:uncharacterized protein (DUF1800 family)